LTVTREIRVSDDYAVTQVEGGTGNMKEPCPQCPWRMDLPTGVFPPEAFRVSAATAYDAAFEQFACHMSGIEHPKTCAGFLLRNSVHNIGARLARSRETFAPVSDGGLPLYPSYRAMAVANGVDPADPVLEPCRADNQVSRPASSPRRSRP